MTTSAANDNDEHVSKDRQTARTEDAETKDAVAAGQRVGSAEPSPAEETATSEGEDKKKELEEDENEDEDGGEDGLFEEEGEEDEDQDDGGDDEVVWDGGLPRGRINTPITGSKSGRPPR